MQYRGKFNFLPILLLSAKLYALNDFWSSYIHILPKVPALFFLHFWPNPYNIIKDFSTTKLLKIMSTWTFKYKLLVSS